MPRYPNFVGGSAEGKSSVIESARSVNWYAELIESGSGKNRAALLPTPGLEEVWDYGDTKQIRALVYQGGLLLAVAGDKLIKLNNDFVINGAGQVTTPGTTTLIGTVASATTPASISYNGTHYFITSGGSGYLFTAPSTFAAVSGDFGQAGFADGYFIAIKASDRIVKISNLYDGSTWSALDYATKEDDPGDVLGMFISHNEVWLHADKTTWPYYNSGDADFPYVRIPGAVIERGIMGGDTVAEFDNSIAWVGADARGQGAVWRAEGHTPRRISNHEVERDLHSLTSAQALALTAYSYRQYGHEFYNLNLPATTWSYDALTGLWHERQYMGASPTYTMTRHKTDNVVAAFGYLFAGDRTDGKVYIVSSTYSTDNDDPIKRIRVPSHLYAENHRLFMHNLEVHLETGLAPAAGAGSSSTLTLRYSWDGGKTWTAEDAISVGTNAEYSKRVRWRRLGSGWDFVPEISTTDPIPYRLIDAFYEASLGVH